MPAIHRLPLLLATSCAMLAIMLMGCGPRGNLAITAEAPAQQPAPPSKNPGALPDQAATAPDAAMVELEASGRHFRELSQEERAELARLHRQMGETREPGDLLALLAEAEEFYGVEILELVRTALSARDPWVREAALYLLHDNPSPAILPLVERGLSDPEEEVRETAAGALGRVPGSGAFVLLEKALQDGSSLVRLAALDAVEKQSTDRQERLLEQAIRSRHEDLFFQALSMLEYAANEQALRVLFKGLASPVTAHREEVTEAIYHLLGERFSAEEEATLWWEEHRRRFGRDLLEHAPLGEEESR